MHIIATCCLLNGLLGWSLVSGAVAGNPPDPEESEVQPWNTLTVAVVCPNSPTPVPASKITVTVRDSNGNPLPNESVDIIAADKGDLLFCDDWSNGVHFELTDSNGEAEFVAAAGGCDGGDSGLKIQTCVGVNFDIIECFEFTRSPDHDGGGANLVIDFSDLVSFSGQFLGVFSAECHDYDDNAIVDLSDLIIFSPTFTNPNFCVAD